jgi:hypothetical protein
VGDDDIIKWSVWESVELQYISLPLPTIFLGVLGFKTETETETFTFPRIFFIFR